MPATLQMMSGLRICDCKYRSAINTGSNLITYQALLMFSPLISRRDYLTNRSMKLSYEYVVIRRELQENNKLRLLAGFPDTCAYKPH